MSDAPAPNLHAYKRLAPAAIRPWEGNPRLHSEAQLAQLVASIREFGFTNPVLVDEAGLLIAGHGRLAAAQQLALAEIPAIEVGGLTDAQKRALMLADNQLATKSDWSAELLMAQIAQLDTEHVKLAGFDDAEIARLTATIDKLGENDATEAWKGMPEFQQLDADGFQVIKVHFRDEAAVREFAEWSHNKITPSTRACWYPAAERYSVAGLRVVSDEPEATATA